MTGGSFSIGKVVYPGDRGRQFDSKALCHGLELVRGWWSVYEGGDTSFKDAVQGKTETETERAVD